MRKLEKKKNIFLKKKFVNHFDIEATVKKIFDFILRKKLNYIINIILEMDSEKKKTL